jgi:oxygen-independent coproporphyrinogen-3 oxidase
LLRQAGVTSINFDLMYGLPGQTGQMLATTLARSVELGADRIALFGYAHVPHMQARQRRIDASTLPGQAQRFAMAWQGLRHLTASGYQPVGFDHFALPGDPLALATVEGKLHRNFQGFTDDAATTLIGLGASAISSFPTLLVQNEKNAGRYRMRLSQGALPTALGLVRSKADQTIGKLIEALLCQGEAQVGARQLALMDTALAPFVERGLATIAAGTLRIEPDGLAYARTIAALFDPYRQRSQKRFSSAV